MAAAAPTLIVAEERSSMEESLPVTIEAAVAKLAETAASLAATSEAFRVVAEAAAGMMARASATEAGTAVEAAAAAGAASRASTAAEGTVESVAMTVAAAVRGVAASAPPAATERRWEVAPSEAVIAVAEAAQAKRVTAEVVAQAEVMAPTKMVTAAAAAD